MSDGFLLRIKYRIDDRLAFLSHLETIRSVERIVRRAGLPFAITEGFNPHMKIAFGPALPVGAGSLGEYVDLRLKEYVDPELALAALQAAAPANLMPIVCEYLGLGADAIDVAYPVSVWEVELEGCDRLRDPSTARPDGRSAQDDGKGAHGASAQDDGKGAYGASAQDDGKGALDVEEVRAAFDRLLERGYIEVKKVKGRKETVKRIDFEGRLVDGPRFEQDGDVTRIRFTTYQGNEGALRPDRFVAAALEGLEQAPAIRRLTRLELKAS